MDVELHAFLTSARDEGEWSASCPGRFTNYIATRVAPRAGLDAVTERKISSSPCREPNLCRPVLSLVAKQTEVSGLLILLYKIIFTGTLLSECSVLTSHVYERECQVYMGVPAYRCVTPPSTLFETVLTPCICKDRLSVFSIIKFHSFQGKRLHLRVIYGHVVCLSDVTTF